MLLAKIVNTLRFVLEIAGIGVSGIAIQTILASINQLIGIAIGIVSLVGVLLKVRKEFKKEGHH